MSAVYPKFKQEILGTLVSSTIKAALIKSAASYNAGHDFLDDIIADVIATAIVTGKSVTDGVFDAGDVLFSGVAPGNTYDGAVLYIDTGVNSTSRLICWLDGPLLSTNGGNVTLEFSNSASKIFAL